MQKLTLWSKRFDVARGTHWRAERNVTEETARAWFDVFKNDEPNVIFVVSARKPPMRKAGR